MAGQALHMDIHGDRMVADIYRCPEASGAPVLLIHGWGGSGSYWKATIRGLQERYELIVPDLPGVGRSMPVAHGRTIFDQVTAIESLIDHLKLPRLRVVGHSMGAAIAILLADKRPELVERLVLVGISLFSSDSQRLQFEIFVEMASLLMRMRTPVLAELPLLTRLFAQRFFYKVPDDDQLLRDGFLDYLQMDYDTAIACARSSTDPRINEAAAHLKMPTLLLAARNDQVMPVDNVPETLRSIPDCQLRWIERSGHLPMVEHADEFVSIVDTFFQQK